MYIKPPLDDQLPAIPPSNPTDEQRHEMLRSALIKVGRPEDYQNIVGLLGHPPAVTQYANPGELKGLKVGIVGGGIAGMATAFELRKLGFDITVFEPNTQWIGGRIYTHYFDNDKKYYGELGAGRIPASHEIVWHYINLFKLNTEPIVSSNSNAFMYVRNVRVRNDPRGENVTDKIYPLFNLTEQEVNTPWPELYYQTVEYHLSQLSPEVRKQFLMLLLRYDPTYEELQNISLRQALQKYGLSSEAINLITSLMPSLGALINNSYESELHSEYTLDYQNPYRISGGMSNLPLAFYKSLVSPTPSEYPDIPREALGKVYWKSGFAVNGFIQSEKGKGVTLRYRNVSSTHDIYEDFDYVICALPFPKIRGRDIIPDFSPAKMQAIKEVYYQDAQKTLFLCRERFWEKQGIFRGSSVTDEINGMIVYPHDHALCTQIRPDCSPDEPGVLLASYNMGQDAFALGNYNPYEQYMIIRSRVEKVHGLPRGYLDENKIITASKTIDWTNAQWFNGAFQFFLPGQKSEFLYVSSTPEFNNRVFFAGDHTSRKNGWMQGALWSAMRAAQDVSYFSIIHKYQKIKLLKRMLN